VAETEECGVDGQRARHEIRFCVTSDNVNISSVANGFVRPGGSKIAALLYAHDYERDIVLLWLAIRER